MSTRSLKWGGNERGKGKNQRGIVEEFCGSSRGEGGERRSGEHKDVELTYVSVVGRWVSRLTELVSNVDEEQ